MSHFVSHPRVGSQLDAAVTRDEHGVETISTVDVEPTLRNAVWEARNRSHLLGLKTSSPQQTGVVGTMRSAVINGVSVADITGNAHTVERTPEMARQLPVDSLMLTFVLAGESFHFNGTSPVLVKEGEVAIYDSDTPFLLGFSQGMRVVVASVPRYHLADIGMQDAFRTLKVMRHSGNGVDSQSSRHLLDVLQGAFETPTGVNAHEFGETFIEATLQALRRLSGQAKDSRKDYVTEAMAFIEGHLADPDLSVERIARALSLSQRHLSRTFSSHGTTVAQATQQLRLENALTLLTTPEGLHMTAAQVGQRSGFSSPSHFSRAFRKQFGVSPTQARRGHQRGDAQPPD